MSSLRNLASQTVIYGLTTILARLLNFALTPLHTHPDQIPKADYGLVNDLYSMIAFLMVILTFGMETAFFRFQRDDRYDKDQVFSHAVIFTLFSGGLLLSLTVIFKDSLAEALQYEDRPFLLVWMMAIVVMEAIAAVPFARLRAENQALRFLWIRLGTVGLMVLLNLIYFKWFPSLYQEAAADSWLNKIYDPSKGLVYVFLFNLIGNLFMILLFLPELMKVRFRIDQKLVKKMLVYSSPLVLAGLAGIINEKAQYQFMKYLLPEDTNKISMGTYGAMTKIATFMMLFIQAFRFAAEPFFFNREGDFQTKMSQVMKYFVMLQSLIFLGLVCFTDFLQWTRFINPQYYEGWHIVPILLFANLLLGINFNLNIWYKLENKTRMGIYINFFGLAFTLAANLILVPVFDYTGAALATLISFAAMTAYSYYLNQKHQPTAYPLRAITFYLGFSLLGSILSYYLFDHYWLSGLLIFGLYGIILIWLEWPQLKTIRRS